MSRPNLQCLYCDHRYCRSDASWREGRMRCPKCGDPNFKEFKFIDTYPHVKSTAGTIPREEPKKEEPKPDPNDYRWWQDY